MRARSSAVRSVALGALVLLAVLACAALAHAHVRSASYSSWSVRSEGATVRARLSALDESALWAAGLRAEQELPRALTLEAGGQACTSVAGSISRLDAADGFSTFRWEVACEGPAPPDRISSELLIRENPTHLHFARVTWVDGNSAELVLDESQRVAGLSGASHRAPSVDVASYVRIGIGHILSGWDHLAFLLVLLVAAARLREVAVVVTGFSIGHGATLCLTALGYVAPQEAPVEALIGLSVALVAFENLWLGERRRHWIAPVVAVAVIAAAAATAAMTGRAGALAFAGTAWFAACYLPLARRTEHPTRLRSLVAVTFGLVHGFGFASSLGALSPSGTASLPALLGFNVGVELGQLMVVALAWPLLVWLRRRHDTARRRVVQVGSALALSWGVFWFAERAFGV